MAEHPTLHLFEGVGIELEYMIVDRRRLDVLPVCDRLMQAEAGEVTAEIEFPDITWNNELVLHVIEFKTSSPVPSLDGLARRFDEHIARARSRLDALDATLMPTSMHPWMDPAREARLWPHEMGAVYEAFDRVFDCRGHGWSNLQSMHINLPFANDEEFGRLHAAIRLVLPILPALAASSPIVEGRVTPHLDSRMDAYRRNCARIPCVTGQVIPEPVFTMGEYDERILRMIYEALRPHDPDGVLRHEWVNARGAIPRFDRHSFEIRVLDVQECPAADLAIAAAVVSVLELLVSETWSDLRAQQAWPVEPLGALLDAVIREGEQAPIESREYLAAFGWAQSERCTAGQLWKHILDQARSRHVAGLSAHDTILDVILERGPLARRILETLVGDTRPGQLRGAYARLCDQLAAGRVFPEAAL